MKNDTIQIEETIKTEIELKPNGVEKEGTSGFRFYPNIKFFLAGTIFGIVLIKSEVISWFRIQEMFRLQSFHMFGVMGTAVLTGMIELGSLRN